MLCVCVYTYYSWKVHIFLTKTSTKRQIFSEFSRVIPYNMVKKKKPDNSLFVYSEKNVSFDFQIREFPWTQKQQNIIDIAQKKNTKIVFIKACAGVGKTLLATYVGLSKIKEKKAAQIAYIRVPVESCSHGIGFVPGDKDEKMDAFLAPAMDHLNTLVVNGGLQALLNGKHIEAVPLGYLKGRTFNNTVMILDEAEDMRLNEFKLAMNRLGKFSLMFVIGDSKQSDIKNNGFEKVYNAFDNEESRDKGIYCFEFDSSDCMRSEITKFIIDTFDSITP